MILVFDFGATRIKSAAFRRGASSLIHLRDSDGGSRVHGAQVPAAYFSDVFRTHLDWHAARADERIDAIWIASEMHGFLLIGAHGEALTPYVSWRANLDVAAFTDREAEDVLATTGVRLRQGLPILNLAALVSAGALPSGSRLAGIPEWLASANGSWNGTSHITLAASTGLVDIRTGTWSPKLSQPFTPAVSLPVIFDNIAQPFGHVRCNGRNVPVFGGIGDLQAALAGLDLQPDTLSLNLGTGSQVSRVVAVPDRGDAELRPFFNGTYLRTQTHISAGRSLAAFADLFDEIGHLSGGQSGGFWRAAESLTVDDVLQSKIMVDLAMFEGAWQFKQGGSISRLQENRMSARDVVAGICRGWITQYPTAADLVDPFFETHKITLSGGLPRRLGWVAPVAEQLLGRPARLAPFSTDETLHGLAALARNT